MRFFIYLHPDTPDTRDALVMYTRPLLKFTIKAFGVSGMTMLKNGLQVRHFTFSLVKPTHRMHTYVHRT